MNIVVCIKQTFDTEAKIALTANGRIDSQGVNMIMNPYDEFAVEEALRIKEKLGGEVIVVSLGGQRAQEAIRQALAMGADKAMLLCDPAFDGGDSHTVALALAKAISTIPYDLVLGGWVAIDDNAAQVNSRLAEALGIPQVNVVTKLDIEGDRAICQREVEGAQEIIEVPLPAVVTAQKGLNEPRYPSLKGIMGAKKKEMKQLKASDLGLAAGEVGAAGAKATITGYSLPEQKRVGKVIDGELPDTARELVRCLREEAKVI